MSSVASPHPDTELVRRFGLGQLDDDEARPVESHVAECDRCAAVLQEVQDDTLVGMLRRGDVGSGTPPADPGPDADAARTAHYAAEGDVAEIPDPLREHPRYRVVRLLGRGGMGSVYLAEHRHMGRPVALKVIKPSLLEDPVAVERFRQEVRSVARLWHPNIVQADDADQAGDLHFLIMEYLEGQSLSEYLEAHGPLPAAEACDYARQAALGLQHAHVRGLTHRDIKPHNLMRTPAGRIKILDFGLAGVAGEREARSAPLTGAGAVVGTADYIAPEQARDAHAADIRADIYSLGCTLYHLLAGCPPFSGQGTPVEKMLRHVTDEPTPLGQRRADLSANLEAVVARMMAKDPADRYQTPAEVAAVLAGFAGEPDGAITPSLLPPRSVPRPAAGPLPERWPASRFEQRRGRRWWGAAVVVLALLLAAAGAAAAVVYATQAAGSRRQLALAAEQVRHLRQELAEQQEQTEEAQRREQEAKEVAQRARQGEQSQKALVCYSRGTNLLQRGDLAEAVKQLREAVALDPDFPEANCNLGLALQRQGQFAEALAPLKRGHELGSRSSRWRYPSAEWVQTTERLNALDGKLPALLRGEGRPADDAERLALADLCRVKKLHAAAVRFAAEAFAHQPALAEDVAVAHRYNAACAAVLAGTGQGGDAAGLNDGERARLRRQALDWLRAELGALARQPAGKELPHGANGHSGLAWWQQDPDLAAVREAAALARLPGAERQAWRQLWTDVAAQLAGPSAAP